MDRTGQIDLRGGLRKSSPSLGHNILLLSTNLWDVEVEIGVSILFCAGGREQLVESVERAFLPRRRVKPTVSSG